MHYSMVDIEKCKEGGVAQLDVHLPLDLKVHGLNLGTNSSIQNVNKKVNLNVFAELAWQVKISLDL
jgi:hypothetical protein